MNDLWAAMCLVLVLEGLVLFAAPAGWQEMMRRALEFDPRQLRVGGAIMVVVGLICLFAVRGA